MTDTEVHVEHPEHESESIAEDVAEEIKEVLEEIKEDEERTESISEVESKTEALAEEVTSHGHPEYATVGHTHPEADHSERLAILESRIENIEHGLAEDVEEPVVEEIEPTHEPEPPAEETKKRRHSFGGRR